MMEYWIWLSQVLGAGNRRVAAILETFRDPKTVYEANAKEWETSGLFTETELRRMKTVSLRDAEMILRSCEKQRVFLIPFGSKAYPISLTQLPNPPVLLYGKGTLPDFNTRPTICIVGPRKVSAFGQKAAYSLGYRLALAGMTIVSGGARGADTAAHVGALKAGGNTVMVMACGFGASYLPENAPLRDRLTRSGCLLTEYPPGTTPTRYSFPIRNRLMAALAGSTVLIEAPEISGGINTAHHTMELGKEVFVIPGSPGAPEYAGSNALLRDGAKPLLDLSDVLNEYLPRFSDKMDIKRALEKKEKPGGAPEKRVVHKKFATETLSKEAQIVYNHIHKKRFYPEEIDADLPQSAIIAALTELEIEWMIKALPGGQYLLIEE